MSDDTMFAISPEQEAVASDSLKQLKAILDNKEAMIAAGVFSKAQISQMEESYSLASRLMKVVTKPKA